MNNAQATGSRWRRIWQSYATLLLAVVIGSLLSIPVLQSRVASYSTQTYILRDSPDDDQTLVEWGRAYPGVERFTAERSGSDLTVRWVYRGISQNPALNQITVYMQEHGYTFQGMRGGGRGLTGNIAEVLIDPLNLAAMLCGMQLAFLILGLYQIRRLPPLNESHPPPQTGHVRRAVLLGIITGFVLLGVGEVYAFVLKSWLPNGTPGPWDQAATMPAVTKAVFLIFGAIGAPIAEEVFFRGYIFGSFWRAGDIHFGVLYSAFLFAVIHFSDPYNIPCIVLFGIVLACLYHQTGSLLAPIMAHAVNNLTAILQLVSE